MWRNSTGCTWSSLLYSPGLVPAAVLEWTPISTNAIAAFGGDMESRFRSRLVVFVLAGFVLVTGIFFFRSFSSAQRKPLQVFSGHKLRVLSYSTFVGSTGPGHELIEDFKELCNCEVEILTAGDAGLLLERLRLSKTAAPFDLVIGLDQLTVPDAEREIAWHDIDIGPQPWAEKIASHVTKHFVPFDWSPLAFIYRKNEITPPTSIEDLASPRFANKVAIQDPRASTPGLQMLQWIVAVEGDETVNFLTKFKANVQSVSPSWSFSYGLFKKGQAQLVFSYLTSLAYHWEEEKDQRYQAAVFPEGHPYQIEFVGIPGFCTECDLARDFVKFMLSKKGQQQIYRKNFMFPALAGIEMSKSFRDLPSLKLIELPKESNLEVWMNVFRK
jgi:thiamine transport system substrate-binding protein